MKGTAAEMAARGAIEGASVRLRGEASAVSIACSLGIPQTWWMRRKVLFHEVIFAGEVLVERAFRHVGGFG